MIGAVGTAALGVAATQIDVATQLSARWDRVTDGGREMFAQLQAYRYVVEILGEAKTAVGAGMRGAGAAHLLGTGLTNSTLRTRT